MDYQHTHQDTPPCQTDQYGQRYTTPDPAPQNIVRNFGAPHEPEPQQGSDR
ncbi:hypothetical protein BX265_4970 [Streptomyces sp. TLI_235]|nr:hypothetical protein [Streptomyces sp. TLI_235]PBC80134.1 hypothetical protein BX265_4970 [Streptomyces sp. TLI_235]